MPGDDHRRIVMGDLLPQERDLGVGVRREVVDGDHARQAVVVTDVVDVPLQVGDSLFQRGQILLRELLQLGPAVILERADRRDQHDEARPQAGLPAFDVDELFRAQVRAESGFGDDVVRELQRRLGRDHRVAPVRDIGERAAVNEGGVVLEGLHEIRLQRVLQQDRHRTVRLEVARMHGLLVARVADDDLAEPRLEIGERLRKAEDRHDFGGDDDVEAVLPRKAVARAAQRDGDVSQRAVVHVHDALPRNASHVDAQRVAVVDVIVEERGEEVVGHADRVEIAGEMQVDVFHRHHLRKAAARGAALHAEDRTERGLAQADRRLLADPV